MQKITVNHREIKKWSQARGGTPALIDHPRSNADTPGIRINFPGNADDPLLPSKTAHNPITWEEFFRLFDEQNLMFVYDTEPNTTDPTLWYKFVKSESTINPPPSASR